MNENNIIIITTWKWRRVSFFCNNKYLFYLFFISWRSLVIWWRLTFKHTHTHDETGCEKLVLCVVFYYITLFFISNMYASPVCLTQKDTNYVTHAIINKLSWKYCCRWWFLNSLHKILGHDIVYMRHDFHSNVSGVSTCHRIQKVRRIMKTEVL